MPVAEYRHYHCRITDDLVYKGMRTVFLENELIRVGLLLDKGADIFQFVHKPSDTDFLWRSPQGLINPNRFNATIAHPSGAFLDSYHGGWQEILPGGGPTNYRGADLGLHGEVTHLGWEYDVLKDTPECVTVRLYVNCVRTPLKLEKILRIEQGKPTLFIEETVTNLSPEPIDFMWGHHPAFGAPFLRKGLRLFVPAAKAEAHNPQFAPSSVLEPGSTFEWPVANINGRATDFSHIPGPEAGYSELLYLKDLAAGWYAVLDAERRLGFGLAFEKEVFPYLWFWLVYGKFPGYPWWDRVYCIALEPWTSIPNSLPEAIAAGNQAHLKGGDCLTVSLSATAISGVDTVSEISLNGAVS